MDEQERIQMEAQRRAFEAQFGSLESMGFEDKTKQSSAQASSSSESDTDPNIDSESDFNGFSDQESSDDEYNSQIQTEPLVRTPRIVKFNAVSDQQPSKLTRKQQQQVRSGKAPRLVSTAQTSETTPPAQESDNEAENLKNDIELQQFLQESNLLSALNSSHSNDLHGKARSRTLEMRLQSISSTNAVSTPSLEKMPMAVRNGMVRKHLKRISTFESESREAGTVLSKVRKGDFRKIPATYSRDLERRIGSRLQPSQSSDGHRHRERGLKINTVGKSTRNGLRLSKAEIAKISGSK